jgi:hypothetical protein
MLCLLSYVYEMNSVCVNLLISEGDGKIYFVKKRFFNKIMHMQSNIFQTILIVLTIIFVFDLIATL